MFWMLCIIAKDYLAIFFLIICSATSSIDCGMSLSSVRSNMSDKNEPELEELQFDRWFEYNSYASAILYLIWHLLYFIYNLFINSCVVFDGNNVVVGVEQHGQLDSDFILPSIIGAMQLKTDGVFTRFYLNRTYQSNAIMTCAKVQMTVCIFF